MFKKITHVNAFTILNIHIFLNKKKKSDNEQDKIIISEQDFRLHKAHFKIFLFKLEDI